MNKLTTFIFWALLIGLSQEMQSQTIYDSIYYFTTDTTGTIWSLDGKDDDFIYESGLLKRQITYKYSGHTWVPDMMKTISYSLAGDADSTLVKVWNEGAWLNKDLKITKYNSLHKLTYASNNTWQEDAWQNDKESLLTYDTEGRMLTQMMRLRDHVADSLVNHWLSTYSYSTAGQIDTIINEIWSDQVWTPYIRQIVFYDSTGKKTGSLEEDWEENGWVNSGRTSITYSDTSIVTLDETYFYGEWHNLMLETAYYDTSGRYLNSLILMGNGGIWENNYYMEAGYDEYGYQNYFKSLRWNENEWQPQQMYRYTHNAEGLRLGFSSWWYFSSKVQGDSTAYYFTEPVNVYDIRTENHVIYPNPCHDWFEFNTHKPVTNIEIFDLKGTPVKQIESTVGQIDISELPKGLYFVKYMSAHQTGIEKILKL